MKNPIYEQFLGKAQDAVHGGDRAWSVQSTGERLAVALALNRFDWLSAMGYTIPEAIDRLDQEWVALIPVVAKALRDT